MAIQMRQHKLWQSISVPKVDTKKFLDFPYRKSFCQILQIQSGYSKLNEYRHKLGLCDSIECICGEPETPEYFLIHCPNYQHCRESMQLKLLSQFGLDFQDAHTLLSNDDHPERSHKEVSCSLHRSRFSGKIPYIPLLKH